MRQPTTMPEPDTEDIVQIIPATGWYAVFQFPEGREFIPLCAWGLQRNGDVVGLSVGVGAGAYDYASTCHDVDPFDHYAHRPDLAVKTDPSGPPLVPLPRERAGFFEHHHVVNDHACSML